MLSRFDRDVLSQPGVSHVMLLIGINDFGLPGGAQAAAGRGQLQQMVAAFRQLITRAHDRGVKVIGATLLPLARFPSGPAITARNRRPSAKR